MGRAGWPDYYQKLGDAIADSKKAIAKIETNVYTKDDVLRLVNANAAIMKFILDKAVHNENID